MTAAVRIRSAHSLGFLSCETTEMKRERPAHTNDSPSPKARLGLNGRRARVRISKQGHGLLLRRIPDQEDVIYESARLDGGLPRGLFTLPEL